MDYYKPRLAIIQLPRAIVVKVEALPMAVVVFISSCTYATLRRSIRRSLLGYGQKGKVAQ